jgi:hypothetical protein
MTFEFFGELEAQPIGSAIDGDSTRARPSLCCNPVDLIGKKSLACNQSRIQVSGPRMLFAIDHKLIEMIRFK